jgi:hypothetical protein
MVRVRWRVPRDLTASDSYVLKFQSAPLRLCEVRRCRLNRGGRLVNFCGGGVRGGGVAQF